MDAVQFALGVARKAENVALVPRCVWRMQHHLACDDPVCSLQRFQVPCSNDRAQFRVFVVDIQTFKGPMNAKASSMPIKRRLGGGNAIVESGG